MKKFFFNCLLLLLATAFVGCKETPDVPPTPVDKPDFVIEVGAVTDTSVEFTITPEDEEMTYIAMMTTKEYFDKFEDDDAYIMDDLLWLDDSSKTLKLRQCISNLHISGYPSLSLSCRYSCSTISLLRCGYAR